MDPTRTLLACLAAAALVGSGPEPACGDLFILAHGGQIAGELQNPDQKPRETYIVKAPDGSTVTLARSQVKQVVRQRPAEIEYERLRVRFPETPQGQWELAEWCRQQGLAAQRKVHLQRVIALDPDHAEARRALGYQLVGGKWFTRTELMTREGYQYYKGRWRPRQEIEILEEKRELSVLEKEWFQRLDRWQAWLGSDRDPIARENILAIRDPAALRALGTALKNNGNPEARLLLVEAVARLETAEAAQALAECSLADPVEEVRLACLERLKAKKDPAVVEFYVGMLRHKDNVIVNRAAVALKQMGDPSAIPALIDALVTVHRFRVPGKRPAMTATFPMGGPGGMPGGLALGGGGPKYISRPIENRQVLDALVALSGANFGFNPEAWRSWYAAQKYRHPIDARRG